MYNNCFVENKKCLHYYYVGKSSF